MSACTGKQSVRRRDEPFVRSSTVLEACMSIIIESTKRQIHAPRGFGFGTVWCTSVMLWIALELLLHVVGIHCVAKTKKLHGNGILRHKMQLPVAVINASFKKTGVFEARNGDQRQSDGHTGIRVDSAFRINFDISSSKMWTIADNFQKAKLSGTVSCLLFRSANTKLRNSPSDFCSNIVGGPYSSSFPLPNTAIRS